MNTNEGLRGLFDEAVQEAIRRPDTDDVEGKTIGKYLIGSKLGEGGMGTAYLAKDTSVGRTVVVKVVNFRKAAADQTGLLVERFRREARAACRVGQHPNVAFVYAFDEIDGRHLLVMERIEGRTLRDELITELGRPRAMEPKKAVEVVIGILKGLEAIHEAKIVHRDLKPGNVMLTHKDDQVKILDFGLGKSSEASGDPALDMTLTQARMPVGSPMFMSPEQIRSMPVDGRTDIYSVGAMLFQMLTGKAPFRGKDAVEIFDQHRNFPVPPIVSPRGLPIPDGLKDIVRKALSKKPEDRYATAAEMRAAVEAVDFDPKPVAAVRPQGASRVWVMSIVSVLAVVALAVGITLALGETPSGPRGREATIVAAPPVVESAPPKAVEPRKASGGIPIPPPPPPVATVAQGCESYKAGRTSDAIATLTRALAAKPDDAEGLFCLCGSYVRQPESRADALKACQAYRARPDRDIDKTRQVDLWLRRLKR